jgi:hypothetical protein
VKAEIHPLENIRDEVFLSTLQAHPSRHIPQYQQVIAAAVVVIDTSFLYLTATECTVRIGPHGLAPLVRRSVHFGGRGIYTVIILRMGSDWLFTLAHPSTTWIGSVRESCVIAAPAKSVARIDRFDGEKDAPVEPSSQKTRDCEQRLPVFQGKGLRRPARNILH